jgi:hypothetical protein
VEVGVRAAVDAGAVTAPVAGLKFLAR